MLNPEINSNSPSEKSKGIRLVSAETVINQITFAENKIIKSLVIGGYAALYTMKEHSMPLQYTGAK